MNPLITIVLFLLCSPVLAFQSDWKKSKEKNGITIWTRSVEQTNIKEFKAEAEFETSLSRIVTLFFKTDDYKLWVEECREITLLDEDSYRLLYHMILKVPFPFDDRDIVQQLQFSQDSITKALAIKIENRPKDFATIDGIVRMPIADGTWVFQPTVGGRIKVTFQYLSDPGGKMPGWLVNSFIVQSPYNSMLKLRDLLKETKYDASYPWLIESSAP